MTMPTGKTLLARVSEGMAVYDVGNQRIGTVKDVFMGGVEQANAGRQLAVANRRTDADADASGGVAGYSEMLSGNVFDTLGGGGDRGDEVQQRLEREGYIRIDVAGLFASDRYATPGQIAEIAGDRIILAVSGDELAKA